MESFRDILSHCDFEDLGYKDPAYTWAWNRVGGTQVRCRLDQVVADQNWQEMFPSSYVQVRNGPLSDHCAVILHCRRMMIEVRKDQPCRFEGMWLGHEKFGDHVTKLWSEDGQIANPSLCQKIQQLQVGL